MQTKVEVRYILEVPFATPEYDELIALRYEILRRPLGMTYDPADLALEYNQIHLAAYDTAFRPLGCLSLLPMPDGRKMKMRQVAVAEAAQGSGVGRKLVAACEQQSRQLGYTKMVLHARDTAVPFYEKLGYIVDGEGFEEVGLPHHAMYKDL